MAPLGDPGNVMIKDLSRTPATGLAIMATGGGQPLFKYISQEKGDIISHGVTFSEAEIMP